MADAKVRLIAVPELFLLSFSELGIKATALQMNYLMKSVLVGRLEIHKYLVNKILARIFQSTEFKF